jgi:DNA-binding transcriptional ArsR family regulator
MNNSNTTESPLDAVAVTAAPQAADAFKLLSNETRLAILLALWEAEDPRPPFSEESDEALSFSELHDRVDMRDSGNFNYHLDELVGTLVRETDEGYKLTTPAERVLSAVFSGTLTDPPSFEGEPIDAECYRCGSQVVVDYTDTRFVRRCTSCEGIWQNPGHPSGTLVGGYRPPLPSKIGQFRSGIGMVTSGLVIDVR